MSNSLKNRIFLALLLVICMILDFCILYNSLFYRKDWLNYSIMWTLFWAIGFFVSQTIISILKKSKKNLNLAFVIVFAIIIEAILSLIIMLALLLITNLILGLPNWNSITSYIWFPFAESLFISNILLPLTK